MIFMAVTTARKVEGYSNISEEVLAESSIIRQISRKDIVGTPGTTTVKVYVNELATIADYVPGTGVAVSADGSAYVTISNLKEKAINEIMDGFTVETAPSDYVVKRLMAAMDSAGEQIDKDGFIKMEADGTELVAAAGAAPTVSNIYGKVINLKVALDNAKAPQKGRSLIISPEVQGLMLSVDSKLVLDTSRGDMIQTDGYIGRVLGFDVFVTTLLPAGTNMVALQERAFVFGMAFTREVMIQSLDGSGTYIGDAAVQGRWAYVTGAVRPTLIQVDNGAA
jgi:hypothetical protein